MKVMMDPVGLVGGPVRPPLANLLPEEVTEAKKGIDRWRHRAAWRGGEKTHENTL